MSLEANKDVIRAYVETIFNQRQVERADELVAPTMLTTLPCRGRCPAWREPRTSGRCTWPASPICGSGSRSWLQKATRSRCAAPMRAPTGGTLLGIPPTGKQLQLGGISIFRLAAGKITEQWEQLDRLALMQQLGVLPTPGQAPRQG